MSKHSIRSGRLSRLSASRSSSSASTRRSRRCSSRPRRSRARAARSGRQLLQAPLLAALRRRGPRRGRRAAPTGTPRAPRCRSAPRGTTICGRHAGRRAVVLEAERLQHRGDVLPLDVLEVEPVAADELAVAEREDLHRGAVAFRCDADHVDRSELAAVCRLPLGEVANGEEPVAVAGSVLEALARRRVEHLLLELALDRLRVAGEELHDAVDQLARSPPSTRSPRRAPGSGRCGKSRHGIPEWRPGCGPSQGRKRNTRLSTSSVSRTFFAFAYGPK